jgi:glycosyltransferase involved in cell wall biosynthesis
MRVLIHSNAPWVPTGYGKQTKMLISAIQEMGHEPVVSAFYGLSGSPIEWNGVTVLPAGQIDFGLDVIFGHADYAKVDLILTLMDLWKLGPAAQGFWGRRAASWLPVDCTPLSSMDRAVLQTSSIYPVAMSKFGHAQIGNANVGKSWYMPHAYDETIFKPLPDRRALRAGLGIPEDRFVIGICSANRDAVRKAFPEQFRAFQLFNMKHPESILYVHSTPQSKGGFDLYQLAEDMGLTGNIVFSDQYAQTVGIMDDHMMAEWYNAIDVLSCCSYAEAFGVPLIEAQACGTPVITTHAASMTELSRRAVEGEPFWNPMHRAWWRSPYIDDIEQAYCEAFSQWQKNIDDFRLNTIDDLEEYELSYVKEAHWKQVIAVLLEQEIPPHPRKSEQ